MSDNAAIAVLKQTAGSYRARAAAHLKEAEDSDKRAQELRRLSAAAQADAEVFDQALAKLGERPHR